MLLVIRSFGHVASIHAGFASSATGEAHTELRQEVTALVERLLAETNKQDIPSQASARALFPFWVGGARLRERSTAKLVVYPLPPVFCKC